MFREFGRPTRYIPTGESGKDMSGISAFLPEQRRGLEQRGSLIYQLTGQSIVTLREAGKRFHSSDHKGEEFERNPSMRTEVAINPESLFLPNGNGETLSKQLSLISKFSAKIGKDLPGVVAKLGEASDYAELAFAHERATGNRLFGSRYGYNYTRTVTQTCDSGVAVVGCFNGDGLDVDDFESELGISTIGAAPLVVPASAFEVVKSSPINNGPERNVYLTK